MAYSDIQDKLSQQQMANSVLLAEKYSQGNLFPKGSEGNPYSKNPRAEGARKKREYKKAQEEKTKNQERLKDLPSDADIQTKGNMEGQATPEEVFGEDYEGGPTYLNTLLQIGGAAGSMIPFMGGNMLKMLIGGPNAMAMNFEDTNLGEGGFVSLDKPNIYINSGAEAHILEPNGNWKFDGFYDPKRHGKIFPNFGLVQRNDGMKMAKTPHTPPIEKMVVGNKLENSPLRFKTDQERIRLMEDFSRNYGKYSQKNTPMTIAQRGADGAHTNVRIYEEKDGYGNTYKRVLPYFGVGYGGPIRPKKV